MTIKVTPDLIRCAYELLCETEPFIRWNMPPSEDIKFLTYKPRDKGEFGCFQTLGPDMWLQVSTKKVGHLLTLLTTVAHEMIHLHQHRTGLEINHGPEFEKWSELVCRHHREFDPKTFI